MRLRENGYTAGWTDERCDLLRKLWADGLSASQVAAEMGGITRNAVIGKVCRLGLSRVKVIKQKVDGALPPVPRRKSHLSINHIRELSTFTVPDAPEELSANPVMLLDLEPHHCRWPIGDPSKSDFRFCGGERRDGEPYCTRHCRIAYRPLEVRGRPVWLQRNPRQKAAAI